MSLSDTWWFTVRDLDSVLLLRLNGEKETRLVLNVDGSDRAPGCVQVKSTSDDSGQKYLTTLSLEKFIVVDERFRAVTTNSVNSFLKKLTAVADAFEINYFEQFADSVNSRSGAPRFQSTPKNDAVYTCKFSFGEQVQIFRSLHPKVDCGIAETEVLDKADKCFRRQAMKAMGLDPSSQKTFFGGKFKVALEVSCFSTRCYELVINIMTHLQGMPSLINSSLFRETCGFKDEPKLYELLWGLAEGNLGRNDFNRALHDAKPKTSTELIHDLEMLKTEVETLRKRNGFLEVENKNLKEQLAARKDIYSFPSDSEAIESDEAIVDTKEQPTLNDSVQNKRHRVLMPSLLQSLQESESDSSDSDWSMSPAYPGRDCAEEEASNLLNENIIVDSPVQKRKGIVTALFKTKNKLSRKCKTGEKEYKDQRETDEQETARKRTRLSEVYVVGEDVEALWQDKDPELRTFFRAKIQHMISSDLYKVIFEDGCQRFVKRKEIKKL